MTPEDEKRVREIVAELLAEFETKVIGAFREGLKPIRPNEVQRARTG